MTFNCQNLTLGIGFLFIGLKTMVSQGVKNPLLDLTALEDKSLDEVSRGYLKL